MGRSNRDSSNGNDQPGFLAVRGKTVCAMWVEASVEERGDPSGISKSQILNGAFEICILQFLA